MLNNVYLSKHNVPTSLNKCFASVMNIFLKNFNPIIILYCLIYNIKHISENSIFIYDYDMQIQKIGYEWIVFFLFNSILRGRDIYQKNIY